MVPSDTKETLQMDSYISNTNQMTSNNCLFEDDIVPEADEPPEQMKTRRQPTPDQYKKHLIQSPALGESLLTKAIVTDSDSAAPQKSKTRISIISPVPSRGLSNASTMSTASIPSTADLTSDGGLTSPSRTSTPSPPPPHQAFGLGLIGLPLREQVAIKAHSDDEDISRHQAEVSTDSILGRKRCISFACKGVEKSKIDVVQSSDPAPPKPRACSLRFACARKDEKPIKRLASPPPPAPRRKSAQQPQEEHHRRDSSATIVNAKPIGISSSKLSNVVSIPEKPIQEQSTKFYEFASSVDDKSESWMSAPNANNALMKADCLLEKERKIQKLSLEVDDEIALEEEMDEEDDASDEGYLEDDEDDDEDEEIWSDSAEDDDDEDGDDSDHEDYDYDRKVFNPMHSPVQTMSARPGALRPVCCRATSDSSDGQVQVPFRHVKQKPINIPVSDLPDSTDFVPGTFDEDKALEEAYVSCLEERKLMKKKITPQDIDPSFPTSDPEDDDDEDKKSEEEFIPRRSRATSDATRRSSVSRSPRCSPKARGSPAPFPRRLRSPPPTARRRSPVPTRSRSRSPQNQVIFRANPFRTDCPLTFTKSLPKAGFHPAYLRRRTYQPTTTTATSPKPSRPHFRMRGAIDIVGGLECKRQRRREHHYSKCYDKKAHAGEGVVKMRELGLLNKERVGAPLPKFIISI